MISSMTGFGVAEKRGPYYNLRAEIKSLNHRFFEAKLKLPREYWLFENRLRALINQEFSRGYFELNILKSIIPEKQTASFRIKRKVAKDCYQVLKRLKEGLGIRYDVSLDQVLRMGEVVAVEPARMNLTQEGSLLEAVIKGALLKLRRMRLIEGRAHQQELLKIGKKLKLIIEGIARERPKILAKHREELRLRLQALAVDIKISEERLAEEVVFYAERSDINEELIRLASHLKQWESFLKAKEPIGRQFDFLIQELNREINTIGSKMPNKLLTQMVIDFKAALERGRELVQNIE